MLRSRNINIARDINKNNFGSLLRTAFPGTTVAKKRRVSYEEGKNMPQVSQYTYLNSAVARTDGFSNTVPRKAPTRKFYFHFRLLPCRESRLFLTYFASRGLESYFCSYRIWKTIAIVFSALRLANGTNLLATAQALPTQQFYKRGLFPVSWVELGLSEFQNGGRLSIYHRTQQKIGEKQGYLQKMMLKSKTQNNRTNGKVIMLLKSRHLSALFPWNNFRFELHVSYSLWIKSWMGLLCGKISEATSLN